MLYQEVFSNSFVMELLIAILSLLVLVLCIFVFYKHIEKNKVAYYLTLIIFCVYILSSSKYIEQNYGFDWKLILLGQALFLTVPWGLHKIQKLLKQ